MRGGSLGQDRLTSLPKNDQAAFTVHPFAGPSGQNFIHQYSNPRIVVGIVVESDVTTDDHPLFEMIKVARDIHVIVESVNEQKTDRLFPLHLERMAANRLDKSVQTCRTDIALKFVQTGRYLLNPLVERSDPAVVRIDRVDPGVDQPERLEDTSEYHRGASAIAADFDEDGWELRRRHRARGNGDEQIRFFVSEPTFDRPHPRQDRPGQQECGFRGCGRPHRGSFRCRM